MSQPFQPPPQQPQPPPAPQPQRSWFARHKILTVLGVLILLGLIGALFSPNDPTPVAQPAPAPTVTATKTVTKTEPAETTTKVEEVTPRSCLRALDAADSGFGIASDMIGVFSAALTAVSELDYDEVERQTGKLERLTERLTPIGERYNAEKAKCRAAAE